MAKQTELLAAYLIFGDDLLKREAVLNRLKIRLEEYGDLSFNFDTFNGEANSGEEIVAACTTIPFASEKRLVLVNNADKLKAKDIAILCEYLSDPLESSVLCLIAEKMASSSKLYKAVAKISKTSLIDCSKPKKKDLPNIVIDMANLYGLKLNASGANALIGLTGDDTVRIDSELNKLSLADVGDGVIDAAKINSLVASTVEPKPYELVNAMSSRDLVLCIELLKKMKSASGITLIGMCTSRIRELICAKTAQAEGVNVASRLSSVFNVADWMVKNHSRYADQFSSEELRNALVSSMECEQKMKSGADVDATFMEWMISTLKK